MSAADDYLKDRPVVGHLIVLVTGIVLASLSFSLSANREDGFIDEEKNKELIVRISREESNKAKESGKIWAKEYIDQRIKDQAENHQIALSGIKDLLSAYNEMLHSIDARLRDNQNND